MVAWFFVSISISISLLLKLIFNYLFQTRKPSRNLPPGPYPLPIIGNLYLLRKSFNDLQCMLQSLHADFGPIITLHFGSRPAIFIADRFLAHQALVQNGAIFADRPPAPALNGRERVGITTALYGSTWRVLRRNLTAEMLHSSRVKSYSHVRKFVLERLLKLLKVQSKSGDHPVQVVEHFRFSMYSLLVFMCYGDKIEENKIKEIAEVERNLVLSFSRVSMISIWPRVTKIVFRKQLKKFFQLQEKSKDLVVPLILERKKVKEEKLSEGENYQVNNKYVSCYVDTLLNLQLPEENRNLSVEEILGLCSEFLNAGTDNTSTLLQWIMANLVKYPYIQEKLFVEIKGVMGDDHEEMVKEDDLQKMPYLKAVILEGLRRHPPLHFLIPHAVKEDVVFNGYLMPRNATVNFMTGDMRIDPKVWEDPMSFKPERFLSTDHNEDEEGFDITGSKEIKMMPFGAGRRICPGYALAILHLEYFVANFVWNFEWKAVDGDDVNLEEKQEFSVWMKHPLQALISPRF
ncbi:cytochrome P450 89A2-like [Durio zibethinus]|uniref:Cytochrome P450 89A2-like n=1 Tax=Durio zibethinus TaxID=66656 RepID=A0A6P5YNX6_DURZI|nr:cytochrome P450 89A2-like [Durio zibethinus]